MTSNADHIDLSGGDSELENMLLESGCYVNRTEWNEKHQWYPYNYPYNDESPDHTNKKASRGHHYSISQTKTATHQRQASSDNDADNEAPRIQGGKDTRSRRSQRSNLAGRGDHTVLKKTSPSKASTRRP